MVDLCKDLYGLLTFYVVVFKGHHYDSIVKRVKEIKAYENKRIRLDSNAADSLRKIISIS